MKPLFKIRNEFRQKKKIRNERTDGLTRKKKVIMVWHPIKWSSTDVHEKNSLQLLSWCLDMLLSVIIIICHWLCHDPFLTIWLHHLYICTKSTVELTGINSLHLKKNCRLITYIFRVQVYIFYIRKLHYKLNKVLNMYTWRNMPIEDMTIIIDLEWDHDSIGRKDSQVCKLRLKLSMFAWGNIP